MLQVLGRCEELHGMIFRLVCLYGCMTMTKGVALMPFQVDAYDRTPNELGSWQSQPWFMANPNLPTWHSQLKPILSLHMSPKLQSKRALLCESIVLSHGPCRGRLKTWWWTA